MAPTQVNAEPFIGQVMNVGFGFCPRAWTEADGQTLAISSNQTLFSLIGTTYGGDGRSTFGLPDLRSRNPVHVGSGPGVNTVSWGQRGGANSVTLNQLNLPSHTHTATSALKATTAAQVNSTANGNALATAAAYSGGRTAPALDATLVEGSATTTVANSGGNLPLNTTDPFLGSRWCIALFGIYPSRS